MSKKLQFVIAPLTCFAFAGSLLAEEGAVTPTKDAASVEVVVTAGRGLEQDPLSVPQRVDTITEEELKVQEFVDLDDALRTIPNVQAAPSEGNPNYWQEGFSIRGLGAQRVLTLTDGVRQAGQGIGYGGGNLSLYDLFGVERIEVLKGPGSVLYGTDAFGGVVNIITRNPERRSSFGTNAAARYMFDGSRDMQRGGMYLDVGNENAGMILGGSYSDSEEPNLPNGEDPNSGSFENLGLWGKADVYIDPDTRLRFLGNFDRNTDVLVTDTVLPLPIAVFGPPGSSELVQNPLFFEFPEYRRAMAGVEIESKQLDAFLDEIKSGLYWQQIYREFHRETAYYPTGSPGFTGPPLFVDPTASMRRAVVDTEDEVNTYEWQTQGRVKRGDHLWTMGFDAGLDDADQPETETQTVVAVAGVGQVPGQPRSEERVRVDAQQYRLGAYVQDNFTMDEYEFVPGARLDYFTVEDDQTSFDDEVFGASGSLGLLYHLTDVDVPYVNLATGFRAPDLGERFQDGIVNFGVPSRIIGNPDLDPERSWSAELGYKRHTDALRFEVASFFNQVDDYIGTVAQGVVEGFDTEQYFNLGTVRLYGGEASVEYLVTERLTTYATAGRTWTDERTKVDVPSWIFTYGVQYSQPLFETVVRSITAGMQFRTVLESEEQTDTGGREKYNGGGFTVVDLLLNADLGETGFGRGTIVSGIRNLFDKEYQEPFFAMNQPERNAYVGIQLDF
ncbi:MAG: TonB-dependent receptor [Bdellovibrionota bacterium]|nr:MAG: TonB-dependent receptor [Bdellovibrionota bacterium]